MAQTETHNHQQDDFFIEPEKDRLGYAPFAKHLADSICKMSLSEGFVIAVYGSWGSGKSTLLNFVVHCLKHKPDKEQPIVVHFNAWLFTGNQDITTRFFDQLHSVLTSVKYMPKGLRERIADIAKVVSQVPLPYAQAGMAVATLLDDESKEASELKEELENIVVQLERRIVVAIDDIDRLPIEDIKQLFRIFKAIPNFRNVVYLLVFDKEVVSKALCETQEISPEAYLEKTIQVPFELPSPDKTSLRRLFFEKLNSVLIATPKDGDLRSAQQRLRSAPLGASYRSKDGSLQKHRPNSNQPSANRDLSADLEQSEPQEVPDLEEADVENPATEVTQLFDQTYWSNVYFQGIDHFITNLRDIVHLTDTLTMTYPVVQGEVNPVDFIALESLRVFHPMVHNIIRKNKDAFIEPINYSLDELKNFHNSWLAQLREQDKQAVQTLLRILFPQLQAVWGNRCNKEQKLMWREQHRVCCPEIFPIYFRLTLPEADLSKTQIQAILACAYDAKAFGEKLIELSEQIRPDGTTQVRAFLEKLEDGAIKEIPTSSITSIVEALFDVGEELLLSEDDSHTTIFDFGNEIRIRRIILRLLCRLDEATRFEVLKTSMSQGKALSIITKELENLNEQQSEYTSDIFNLQDEGLISTQHLKELKEIVAKRKQAQNAECSEKASPSVSDSD
ncbi:KAP family P-loop NTPase fold protein [Brasilonema octagenarum]|uniref:NTPase KAP n=1 Tax=Brasilonema octagenarum UFV-OR1 TaxID=417115 RepID=A0ABX1MEX1_9CYAN|nr:P-loop NTPase fold protein [Brasilonema octagenarum]NMF66351.1 NTPase KAP [Brasilonema octagenarum UFV-OR1]